MFSYSDPAQRNFLSNKDVETAFRIQIDGMYGRYARRTNSAFTWLEAFSQLSGGAAAGSQTVDWRAFPLTAGVSDDKIDAERLRFQDEYVEWMVEKKAGKLSKVTFTTEFPEYYEAFASVGLEEVQSAIEDVMPGAAPTEEEIFGPGFRADAASPLARARTFRARLPENPWNNGGKGILCLRQSFNTLDALFNLLTECGVPRSSGTPEATCGLVGGACGPGRSSDPAVCTLSQQAARAQVGFTLRDPAGVRILKLEGVWKRDGQTIDINDPSANQGLWIVSRNGRRGVLTVPATLTLDDAALVTGAQVSHKLQVAADLLTAPDAALPAWARINEEADSRGPGTV